MIRLICGVAALAAVVGCARIQPPQPTADHPANPQAARAGDADLSEVLAVHEEDLPTTPPEMRQGMMHRGHRNIDAGTTNEGSSSAEKAKTCTCPTHPEVTADKPGKCPGCGMNLVPKGGAEHE